jgi:hypothetical protein
MNRVLGNKIKHGCIGISNASVPDGYTPVNCGNITNGFTSITMECWFKANPDELLSQGILSNFIHSPAMDGITLWRIGDSVRVRTGDGVTTNTGANDVVLTVDISKWNHVAATYDGTSLKVYLNASLLHQSQRTVVFGNHPTIIGRWASSYHDYIFEGDIDEVRIWNYARTAEQIKENYTKTLSPQTGLVAYYKLDGNALDSSGNGNNGTVHGGVTWSEQVADILEKHKVVSSGLNGSAEFDGVDDSIDTTFSPFNVELTAVSMETWVYRGGNTGDYEMVISHYAYYIAASRSNNVPVFSLTVNQNGTNVQTSAGGDREVPLNTWTHLAWTYDGVRLTCYMNGRVCAYTDSSGTPAKNSITTRFGKYGNGSYPFMGRIGSSRVWNKALTQQEIQQGMYRTFAAGTPNLIEQWTLGGNADGTNGNDGTPVGGVKFVPDAPRRLLTSRSKQPYALSFDNVDDKVSVPHDGMSITNQVTLTGWFKAGVDKGPIVEFSKDASANTGNIGIHIWQYDTAKHFYINFRNTAITEHVYQINNVLTVGEWYFFAVSCDGTTINIYLYDRNIRVITTGSRTFSGNLKVDDLLLLGHRIHSTSNPNFSGTLYDIRVYNKAKTQVEAEGIAALNTDKDGLLKAQYNNIIPYSSSIMDKSGNGYHGRIEGKPETPYSPVGQRSTLSLDGVDDKVEVTTLPTTYDAVTVEFWVKAKAKSQSAAFGFDGDGTNRFQCFIYHDNLYWDYGDDWSNGGRIQLDFTPYHNKWTHVAVVSSGSANTFQAIYINGEVKASKTSSKAFTGAANIFKLGNTLIGTTTYPLQGKLTGLRMWSKVRSGEEIKANMHRYLPADTANLVEQWKLDEGVGTTAYGTKGNDGSIVGATWRQPSLMNWKGKTVKFGGVNDYVNCGSDDTLSITGSITIEAWIFPVALHSEGSVIVTWAQNHASGDPYPFHLVITPQSAIRLNRDSNLVDSNTSAVVLNTWQHIAVVHDADNGVAKHYVNGVEVKSQSYNPQGIRKNDKFFSISRSDTQFFDGNIDEVRIWNIVRTSKEIAANYQKTLDRHPNLVLNMGFESEYHDNSGYRNHGSPVNNPIIEDCDNDKLLYNAPIN